MCLSQGLDGLLQYTRSTSSTIGNFVTPQTSVITASVSSNASRLLEAMRKANIRHLILTPSGGPVTTESDVMGVVSMRRILNVVVQDERLSMRALAAKFPGMDAEADPVAALRAEQSSYANELASAPGVGREDFIKVRRGFLRPRALFFLTQTRPKLYVQFGTALAILSCGGLFLSQSQWLHDHAQAGMVGIFVLGYVGIIFEELFEFNKAAVALLMSTALWVTYADFFQSTGVATGGVLDQLKEQLGKR